MVTVAVMMATTVVILDMTIASIALPHMQGSLGANQDQIGWVMTTYFVCQAISTACTGWLAGRLGRKRTFLLALAGFMGFSVLSGSATSLPEILVWRACQGAMSAPVIPISQALMLDNYPPERHGSALAIWGTGVMFAPVMGPVVGGFITENYGWQWIFFIGIPFALAGLALGLLFMRETLAKQERPFDLFGFVALACALAALQLLLDRGELEGWFESTEIVIEAAVVVLGFYIFAVHSLTTDNPFISRGILSDRNLALGLFFMFLLGVCVLALNVILPLFLQVLRGLPVMTAGVRDGAARARHLRLAAAGGLDGAPCRRAPGDGARFRLRRGLVVLSLDILGRRGSLRCLLGGVRQRAGDRFHLGGRSR